MKTLKKPIYIKKSLAEWLIFIIFERIVTHFVRQKMMGELINTYF